MKLFKRLYKKYIQSTKSKLKELEILWTNIIQSETENGMVFAYKSKDKYIIVCEIKSKHIQLQYTDIREATKIVLERLDLLAVNSHYFKTHIDRFGVQFVPTVEVDLDSLTYDKDNYFPLDEDDF